MRLRITNHIRVFFKNALFLYALTFSNYLIGLLLLPYLSRVLSVEKFGVIGFATSFCLVFQMVVEYGFQLSTTAAISVHRDDKTKNVPNHLDDDVHQAVAGVRRVGRVLGMRDVREHAPRPFRNHPSVLRGLDRQSTASGRLLQGHRTHEGHYHPRVSAKSGILVATLLFVKGDDTLIIYPVSMIVFDTIALLWAFSLLKRDGLKATSTTMREMLEALKESFWFFISRISVSINGSLGSIFLGMRYSPESVEMGLYSGATKLSSAGEQMIPPLGDALYPSMVNKKDYRLFYRIVLRGAFSGSSRVRWWKC